MKRKNQNIFAVLTTLFLISVAFAEPVTETATIIPDKSAPAGRVATCEGFHRASITNTTPWKISFWVSYGLNPPGSKDWVVNYEVILNPGQSFFRVFRSEIPCVGIFPQKKSIEGFTEIWYFFRKSAESQATGTLFVT